MTNVLTTLAPPPSSPFLVHLCSNLTMLLSKLLHSTADQPVTDWEDKGPLNVAAVSSFLLGGCLTSVVLILFVFLSDFMADELDDDDELEGGEGPAADDKSDDEEEERLDEILASGLTNLSRWIKSRGGGPRRV